MGVLTDIMGGGGIVDQFKKKRDSGNIGAVGNQGEGMPDLDTSSDEPSVTKKRGYANGNGDGDIGDGVFSKGMRMYRRGKTRS